MDNQKEKNNQVLKKKTINKRSEEDEDTQWLAEWTHDTIWFLNSHGLVDAFHT
jgi:hypothetical protein